jgi:quinoprotein glucose dehydrogenase
MRLRPFIKLLLLQSLVIPTILISCQEKKEDAPVDLQITQFDHDVVKNMASEIEATVTPTLSEGLS